MRLDRQLGDMLRALPETLLRNEHSATARLALATVHLLRPAVGFCVVRLFAWELPPVPPSPPPELGAREVGMEELAALAPLFDRTAGELHRRSRLGDRCFCAFARGRAVHARWVATRPVELPELGLYLCPSQEEFYAYDSVTLPAWRGRKASWAARRESERVLRNAGYLRGFARVRSDTSGAPPLPGPSQRLLWEVASLRVLNGRPHLAGRTGHPLYAVDAIPPLQSN